MRPPPQGTRKTAHARSSPQTHRVHPVPVLSRPGFRCRPAVCALLITLLGLMAAPASEEFFKQKIEPLLREHCLECHSHAGKIKGGLTLDSKSGWEKGGDSGPAVIPGNPGASLLIKAVSHVEKDLQMPPKKRLSADQITLLAEWIRTGAADPRAGTPAQATSGVQGDSSWESEFQKRRAWWSLQPMRRGEPPPVADAVWGREPVDRFIKTALDAEGIPPAPAADEGVLRRRLAFVLTGLPSAVHPAADSLEAYVDALLASTHFGERFARHWMDVVRYTDTYGYEWDNPAKGSHEYRDYLIRAFNDDVGFDRMLHEQLAGDLLETPRIHPQAGTQENLIAPMFYHLGQHRHGSSLSPIGNGVHQDMVHNKVDAFSKAFLATTVACARCHDHKLEAVSQRDYYALAALFTSARWTARVADAPETNAASITKLKALRNAIRTETAHLWASPLEPAALRAWAAEHPAALKGVGEMLADPDSLDCAAHLWRLERAEARTSNAAFQPVDLRGWVWEGEGFAHGWVEDGTPLVALEGGTVLAGLLPRGWHSHALSSKLPGSLRSPPQHQVPGKIMSLRLGGGSFGGHLVVDDHAFQNETVSFYKQAAPQWMSFTDATLINGVQQVCVEFCTASLNPNFPPRTGLAAGSAVPGFGNDLRSWVSICGVVSHNAAGTPRDELDRFRTLHESSTGAGWERLSAWLNGVRHRWCVDRLQPGDCEVMQWMLTSGLLPNRAVPGSALARAVEEYRSVEASLAFPRSVMSMDQREAVSLPYPLNVRGNVDVLGEAVQPAFLRMLGGEGIGNRAQLADSLLDAEHPLTARVYVNRVWQWIFGTGLVATPDDFGRLGSKPSHPELLDWLARECVREGWSTKRLVRRLVLSETFRRSGRASDSARDKDPSNRLFSFYATRRLEAEAIRDTLLAVSGRWDRRLYGRPVPPFRAVQDAPKRLFSGPLDGEGRRSIYLQMSIMQPPAFLVGFNLPDLRIPTGRRDVTNVPAQALQLLNDPFVRAMAAHWGAAVAARAQEPAPDRLRGMFRTALGREASESEMRRWLSALDSWGADTPAGWEAVAHAFFNTKEFLYYR